MNIDLRIQLSLFKHFGRDFHVGFKFKWEKNSNSSSLDFDLAKHSQGLSLGSC